MIILILLISCFVDNPPSVAKKRILDVSEIEYSCDVNFKMFYLEMGKYSAEIDFLRERRIFFAKFWNLIVDLENVDKEEILIYLFNTYERKKNNLYNSYSQFKSNNPYFSDKSNQEIKEVSTLIESSFDAEIEKFEKIKKDNGENYKIRKFARIEIDDETVFKIKSNKIEFIDYYMNKIISEMKQELKYITLKLVKKEFFNTKEMKKIIIPFLLKYLEDNLNKANEIKETINGILSLNSNKNDKLKQDLKETLDSIEEFQKEFIELTKQNLDLN